MSDVILDPVTPGEILEDDFMEPLKISINQHARDIAVPSNRISNIVNGKRGNNSPRISQTGTLFRSRGSVLA